jgi:hypothetical protein
MSRPNRLKLRPIFNEEYKLLTPTTKEERSLKQVVNKSPLRFKT